VAIVSHVVSRLKMWRKCTLARDPKTLDASDKNGLKEVHAVHHTLTTERLPRSGNTALASGALIQADIGVEFLLAGLNKVIDPDYLTQFRGYVANSPGATSGLLAGVFQLVVVANSDMMARASMFTELVGGSVLLITTVEVLRRRLAGSFGAQRRFEPLVALVSSAAAFILAALSLGIYVLQGGSLPVLNPAFALTSPVAIELFLVPIALAIAWLEFSRFRAMRESALAGPGRGD